MSCLLLPFSFMNYDKHKIAKPLHNTKITMMLLSAVKNITKKNVSETVNRSTNSK